MRPFPTSRSRNRLLLAWVAASSVLIGCARGAEPAPVTRPTTAPASQPVAPAAASTDDWPAFHGGGGLAGVAADLGDAPLSAAPRWVYKAGVEGGDLAAFEGSPVIAGGVVYAADMKGTLHSVDVKTGQRKWAYVSADDPEKRDGFATTPLVVGGRVLLGDMGGIFHCVSAADGKKVWTFDAQSPIHSSANAATVAGGAGGGVRVVFGTDGADIFCLNLADGGKAWEQKAGDRINGTPAIARGAVLVSGCDAKLRALSLADGSEQFAADIGSICPGSPAALDDRIVVGTDGAGVVCYSADGQRELWKYDKVGGDAMVFASPAASAGVVVIGARDRKVRGLRAADGAELWTFVTRGDVDSSPAISGNRVFVGSKDKRFYVLDLKTGKPLGEFPAGRAIVASPAVGEGVVVVGDGAGNLYCYEPVKR